MSDPAEQGEVATQILDAIAALRQELLARDAEDAHRTVAMEELREELRKERVRRQFLWTPIGILASVVLVVVLLFVNAREQDKQESYLLCQQTNEARSTIVEFLDAVGEDMSPERAAYLDGLVQENLSQKRCVR